MNVNPPRPVSYIKYTVEDEKYHIEQYKEEERTHPQDADYDEAMISLNERTIAIMEANPGASPKEICDLRDKDPESIKLNKELAEIKPPKYFVKYGIKMHVDKC